MRLLQQVCSGPSAEIACWQGKRCEPDRSYQRVCERSASSLRLEPPPREQDSRYGRYNTNELSVLLRTESPFVLSYTGPNRVEFVLIETLKVSTDGELSDGVRTAPANRRD
jgi:hypothetical protein